MLKYRDLAQAARKLYLFLWELFIKIKAMPSTEFEKLINELSAEQKLYALYIRLM